MKKYILKSIFVAFSLVFLSGCFSSPIATGISDSTTNFNTIANNLMLKIYPKLKDLEDDLSTKAIYVTDFVNLDKLENPSKFGFLLSEEVKALVTQNADISIHEIEFTKYLKVGKNGTKLLSRNLKDLKETSLNPNTYALVGTYVLTKKQAIVYIKLINLKKGTIIKSASQKIKMTKEILDLNGISIKEKKKEVKKEEVPIYQPVVL